MSADCDGVLVIDKPAGITSHDVVAATRRRLPRKTKVGHTGTLDPFATGVLPIVVGKATRLAQFLTASRKAYLAEITFGAATDTGDATGVVTETAAPGGCERLDAATVAAGLQAFAGTQDQVPPAHSAKKVDGERAYVLARRGDDVSLAAVPVTAYALDLRAWDADGCVATVALDTSAGYYVRSLARDLGQHLGVPAHLSGLRRTASGAFTLSHARPLGDIVCADLPQLAGWRIPLEELLPEWPSLTSARSTITQWPLAR